MKSKNSALLRMDNVGIVVEDLKAAIAFFVELGLELEGETTVEGQWVDRVVGLNGVRSDIVMMRTPDGHSRLELSKFQKPTAIRDLGPCLFPAAQFLYPFQVQLKLAPVPSDAPRAACERSFVQP